MNKINYPIARLRSIKGSVINQLAHQNKVLMETNKTLERQLSYQLNNNKSLTKAEFVEKYVLNRCMGHVGGLNALDAANSAIEVWERVIVGLRRTGDKND